MNLHSADFTPPPRKRGEAQLLSGVSNSVLHGCNPYFHKTVLLKQIHLGDLGDLIWSGKELAARFEELFLTLPTLIDEPIRTQAFCERLKDEPTKVANILLEAIIAIETAAAANMHRLDTVEFANLYQPADKGQVVACWATKSPSLSKHCADAAIAGVNALFIEELAGEADEAQRRYQSLIESLLAKVRSRRLTTTVCVIREAAKARNIDCAYLGTSYLRLGQGKSQQYFRASLTGNTSHTASQLSVHKRLATRTLRSNHLPVPKQMQANSKKAIRRAAEAIGYPVIVKPLKGYGGYGVTLASGPDDIPAAYKSAATKDPKVIVEEFIAGDYYRLLVINNKFVAALRVAPPEIVGDGARTIRELVVDLNEDPFRDGFRLVKVGLDKRLSRHLSKYDLEFDSVLANGRKLALREIANVSQGGYSIDVTDEVHPDNARAAERAACVVGLDVAGIDFITPDISQSYKDIGGAIIELNSRPGLGMHAFPRYGKSRDVGGATLDTIYPDGSRGNVSSAVLIGEQRTAVVARDLDEILRHSERSVGMAIRNHSFVNGVRSELRDSNAIRTVRSLIRDPHVDTLISTQAPAGIIRRGLQLDNVNVAAIRAPAPETDLKAFKVALAVLLKSNPNRFVFGVRNDLAIKATENIDRSRITLVTRSGFTRRIQKHLASGGNAVIQKWIDGVRHIAIYEGETEAACLPANPQSASATAVSPIKTQSAALTGHRSRRIETRLYAIAMALGLGITVEQIARALRVMPATIR